MISQLSTSDKEKQVCTSSKTIKYSNKEVLGNSDQKGIMELGKFLSETLEGTNSQGLLFRGP